MIISKGQSSLHFHLALCPSDLLAFKIHQIFPCYLLSQRSLLHNFFFLECAFFHLSPLPIALPSFLNISSRIGSAGKSFLTVHSIANLLYDYVYLLRACDSVYNYIFISVITCLRFEYSTRLETSWERCHFEISILSQWLAHSRCSTT